MKKVALVFAVAVIVPSLVLAWLAVRSLKDQQFLAERQLALLCQKVADGLAKEALESVAEQQRIFTERVSAMAQTREPDEVVQAFDGLLRKEWPLARLGFVVNRAGEILSPSPDAGVEQRLFWADYARFLANRQTAEGFFRQKIAANRQQIPAAREGSADSPEGAAAGEPRAPVMPVRKVSPLEPSVSEKNPTGYPRVATTAAEFQQLIGNQSSGAVARFVDNKLNLLFWCRSPRDPNVLFGARVDLRELETRLSPVVQRVDAALRGNICVALLDDAAEPVAVSQANFTPADWKRPFVASEVGQTLPHWEVAVYLLEPGRLTHSVQTVKWILGLLTAVLVLAIGVGSWLIVADLNRELRLAREKTDFVSNVSHELKTPLTSIRMFTELLGRQRELDPAKQRSYLSIIEAETARLTRLINNVLEFARLERGEKKIQFRKCDLAQVARDTVEMYRAQLEAGGFQVRCELPAGPRLVNGDRDALAQIIVNLLANAEKYSDSQKEITVRLTERAGPAREAELSVLDRGVGVPAGAEEKIFEKFYRAHDSLGSGIQGSGLGLTLARQLARAHGGDLSYEPRAGGGSCFTLRLPLLKEEAGQDRARATA